MIMTVFVAQKVSELWLAIDSLPIKFIKADVAGNVTEPWLVVGSLPIEFSGAGIEGRNHVWVVYDLVIVTTGRSVVPNKVVASPQADSPFGKVIQDSEAAAAAGSLRTRAVARVEIRSTGLRIVWYFILLECSRRFPVFGLLVEEVLQSCSADSIQGRCDSFGLGMVDVCVAGVRWSDGNEVGWKLLPITYYYIDLFTLLF
jgi:hypothetical protein